VLFIAFLAFFSARWFVNIYGRIGFDSILYTLNSSLNGVEPDLIVGDFDSYAEPETTVEKIVLPTEKDDTDSIFAVKTAIARGYTHFLLIGMLGGRMDHSLGNLYALVDLHHRGLHGKILCGDSDYRIVGKQTVTIPDDCRYFSLVNLTGLAKGITITGAKYPLADGEILPEYQYGISNEVIPGQTAQVCVQEGELLLIRIFKA